MMTNDECRKTIDWLREFILRLEDRADHEAFLEHINRLKSSANELQERLSALEAANGIKTSPKENDGQIRDSFFCLSRRGAFNIGILRSVVHRGPDRKPDHRGLKGVYMENKNYFLVQVLLDARQREIERIERSKLEIEKLNYELMELGVDIPKSSNGVSAQ